ncbi:MAG: AsmA-like C-terminal region-containing protein, partial [Bacteroidales bacterium]|nr:AsmA-like C-terminal region-containing protein [Bacteroidales bacterium]
VITLYDNRATKLIISGIMESGRIRSRITGKDIDFTGKGDLKLELFSLYDFRISKIINSRVNVILNKSDEGIRFEKSSLVFDDNIFSMDGFVSADNHLDISVKGENVDIANLKGYLPDSFLEKVTEYNPRGSLELDGTIRGKVSRTVNPGINIAFSLKNGNVSYKPSSARIQNVSFDGSFTNGTGMTPRTSTLKIGNFRGKLGSSDYSGSLVLSDFTSPDCILELKGRLIAAEITGFFDLNAISAAEGSADMHIRTRGKIPGNKNFRLTDLLGIINEGSLGFNSFGINLRRDGIRIADVNGQILFSSDITAKDLDLTYQGQRMRINGSFSGLPQWATGKNVTLTASGSLVSDRIALDTFFPEKTRQVSEEEKKPFSFPENVILDFGFSIGDFSYKDFKARNVSGTMDYKPRIFNFNNLNINSLDGFISGNGYFLQNADKSHILKGDFSLEKVNVKRAFTVFNNFGQNFIMDENLEGLLSGSLAILIPMDTELKASVRTVTAEGKYILEQGALLNFEPVRKLSDFIDISELENIRFKELENDFFIRNNSLYIPAMDVRSSAADLSVNGRHGFDNKYEYHVRILLSEILSRKVTRPKPHTSEFGAIRDDGLGRTSLLLKIEDRDGEVRVSYDARAAGTQIRNDIRKERQSLKTIFNEEYGWFSYDTAAPAKPSASGTPRFRVTWEEAATTDTVGSLPEEARHGKQELRIRDLLKKR